MKNNIPILMMRENIDSIDKTVHATISLMQEEVQSDQVHRCVHTGGQVRSQNLITCVAGEDQ